ncbi:MAG: PIN domain-containing protein [Geminicoccaceae bacterium]|nr:PIN domain-containing protein [Geminicoccaceae bacterium]
MTSVLLDTTVASFLLPSRERPELLAYAPQLRGHTLVLSFQSVAELFYLADRNGWGEKRRDALKRFLARFLIVPADKALAASWATVIARTEKLGKRLETADAWIVATALRHDLPLITHDRDQLVLEDLGGRVITTLPRSKPKRRKRGAG